MKEQGKSKAPLALMEQLIMILVFAFAAAVCIQAFVYADQMSKMGEKKTIAANQAQMITEHIKANHGDMKKTSEELEGTLEGDKLIVEKDDMTIIVTLGEKTKYLQEAKLDVESDGEAIYSLSIAWQGGEDGEK